MALTETKFRLVWIVVSAVFILLSVPASAVSAEQQTEGHRCYWCGPLAEQVHRSQRAPTCNGDKSKVTVCDEDLPYCAIVATSPPYVESRFCVKFYQDECYSLYCSTSKTWKITCPCRGELCNGVSSKRETEAFEALLKHNVTKLTQNKRPKRALISKAGFIGLSTRKNKIDNATEESKDARNETVSANIVTDDNEKDHQEPVPTEMVNQATSVNAMDATEPMTEMPAVTAKAEVTESENFATTIAEVENSKNSESVSVEASAESSEEKVAKEEEVDKITEKPKNDVTEAKENDVKQISESIQIDIPSPDIDTEDLKTEIIVMSSAIPKVVSDARSNDMATKMVENISKDLPNTPEPKIATEEMKMTPVTTTVMVKMTTAANVDMAKKSSEKLPTAEALQHNDTPTTKPTEHMTSSTTTMTLNTHVDAATQATMSRNNTAVRVDAHILTIVIGIILHY